MSPVAILFFLVAAVLAWGFRVWILVPITLLAMVAAMVLKLALGASLLVAIADSLLLGLLPQVGYAFGLLARNGIEVVVPRSQGCCGSLMMHTGDDVAARRLALNRDHKAAVPDRYAVPTRCVAAEK